ncbi:MAG: hypothetical protein UZ05_CHB002001470 [Chlorobi bacterium OLB5]|nr:MAG: hypothetical protein UZ05_CHB002001470 [Chlorobi bacterium OLB5]
MKNQLLDLVKSLSQNDVKYVVCGGIACVLHGVERNTYDVDISLDMNHANILKIIEIAKKFNLQPRIPEPIENLLDETKRNNWIQNKGAIVYTLVAQDSPLQMDIFLKYPKTYDELARKADNVIIDGIKIPVSSIDDLILAKILYHQ